MLFETKSDNKSLLWVILSIALLMRLNSLTGFSLSNDELSALARLQFDSIGQVISDGVYVDFHPAGVQIFLYYWTKIFGFSEFAVRLPFVLMGVLAVYFVYLIGKLWFSEVTGLLASASVAVLEFPLLYSQIARPYSPGLLFVMTATYFWTKIIFSNKDEKVSLVNYAGFVLSVSLCMYTHYFSFIFAGLLCFTGLFFLKKFNWKQYFICGAAIAVLYLPHLNILIHQLSKGGVGGADGWLGAPEVDAFQNYFNYCLNDSVQVKYMFIIFLVGSILAYKGKNHLRKHHLLAIFFFYAPVAIAYFYSIYKNPVFQYSVLLFSFPFFPLLVFSFIPAEQHRLTIRFLLFIVLAGIGYSTVYEKKYYTTAHFSEFRGVAEKIVSIDDKYGASNVTKTISIFDPYYINYYLEKKNHPVQFGITGIFTPSDKLQFYQVIEESAAPYFLYAFSNVYDPPEFDMIIRSRFPWLIENDSMLRSGVRLYGKEKVDFAINKLPALEIHNSFEKSSWENERNFIDSTVHFDGNLSVRMNNDAEYSPGLNVKLKDLMLTSGSRIEISTAVYAELDSIDAKLVVSVDDSSKNILWNGVSAKNYFRKQNSWFRVYMVAELPEGLTGNETLKIYFWNEKKEAFWMDDVMIRIYLPR